MIVDLDTNIVASATYWRGKPAHCMEGDKGHLLSLKQAAGVLIIAASDFLRALGLPENPT